MTGQITRGRPLSAFKRLLAASVVWLLSFGSLLSAAPPVSAATDTWPQYLHDNSLTSASSDTTINTANVPNLAPKWVAQTGGVLAASATISNGTVYIGSWDGYEYALDETSGNIKWKAFLGITTGKPNCIPPKLGVSSTATVRDGVVYVGGGDQYWYALDASSGAVLWKVFTGDNSADSGHYNWSSPLIYNGYAYVGVASLGDCPLVQGQLLKINLSTHQIDATFNYVPDGQIGGGLWTTPALDPALNTIYTTTGTENAAAQTYAQAIVAHNADTLAVTDSWKLPEGEAVLDSDFGTSPTMFTDANGRPMLVSINKNGYAYAFDRRHISAGPVWKGYIAEGGACPTCDVSSVSSGAYGQGKVFLAGEVTTINGAGYPGSVRAFDPTTGAQIWAHATTGPVIGALAYANGVVYAGSGNVFEALDAATGNRLFSYDLGTGIYTGPSIANGKVYVGTLSGKLYAFALSTPSTPPADPSCPGGWTCQAIGAPNPAGGETASGGTWSLHAGGAGANGTADALRLANQQPSGDIQVAARLTAQQAVAAGSQAGVMIRQNNTPGSPYYAALKTPGALLVQYRTAFGGATSVLNPGVNPGLPFYLEIQRRGDQYQAATSPDGANWTLVPGTTVTMVLPTTALAGLVVSSGAQGTDGSAGFTNVTVGAPTNTPQPPSGSPCPAGWTCGDIGNPALSGDQTLAGSTWTIKGSGGDIWGSSDQFRFVRQDLSGDGTISAHVTSQTNTNAYAKAGVMLRADSTPGSPFYAVYITPSNGIAVQYRATANYGAAQSATMAGSAPAYLQVARSGNAFTAYASTDGNSWDPVPGSTVTITMPQTVSAGLAVTSHDTTQIGIATFDGVAIGHTAPLPPNICPSGWDCRDIGYPTPAGDQTLSNGTWALDAGGGDIWDTSDQMRLVSQALPGDGSISGRVASQDNTDAWAKAGIMLRGDATPGSMYYAAFVTPSNGVAVQYRAASGGSTAQVATAGAAPKYLKVTRTGTTFSAATSDDGVTWTLVPGSSTQLPGLTGSLIAGLAATSHNPAALSHVVYDHVTISGGSSGALPAPWADADIGGPSLAGSAQTAGGTYTVKGSGWDIWDTADQFNYAYQPLSGDGSITARITSQTNTDPWAKAGVMIKDSATTGADYAFAAATPGNGLRLQSDFTGDTSGGTYTFPVWLRLVRSGDTFTAYRSADGNSWTQFGTVTIAMGQDVTAGLAVTAHNGNALSTATFDNVSITSTALPAGWASDDIGDPGLMGTSTYNAGTFTLNGAGWDIWDTADQFQYAYQTLTGDGTITARIKSQTNTDPWAKAGVMIRDTAAPNQPYAILAATPANGLRFQYNLQGDAAAGPYVFPVWLRLTRSGSTVSAYTSTDGTTWTPAGSITLDLGSSATFGLFVTAHDDTQLSTATFDNVTVTSGF